MFRNPLSLHKPLRTTAIRGTRYMPLTITRIIPLPRTVLRIALMVIAEHARYPPSIPPALRTPHPRTLMITAVPPPLVREARVATLLVTRVIPAELPVRPLALARPVVAPVLPAEGRHGRVVVHVAVPHAPGVAADLVLVAEPPRVARRGLAVVEDQGAAFGGFARVPGAVRGPAGRVPAVVAAGPGAFVGGAEVRTVCAALGAVGGSAAVLADLLVGFFVPTEENRSGGGVELTCCSAKTECPGVELFHIPVTACDRTAHIFASSVSHPDARGIGTGKYPYAHDTKEPRCMVLRFGTSAPLLLCCSRNPGNITSGAESHCIWHNGPKV